MKTAQEIVESLRNELKDLGFSSRKVSIKLDRGTFEDAIWVTVKSELTDEQYKLVKATSEKYQKVDYHKGEIVSGGNLYVFVQ
jgi:hypothetical protein